VYLLVVPKGTPASIVKQIHGRRQSPSVDDPAFAKTMDRSRRDVDYRAGEPLRADLWREYKVNTEILKRIGLIKQ